MKKLLLALLAAAALTGSAQTLDKTNVRSAAPMPSAPAMAPSRADDGYTLRFCNNIYSWMGIGQAGTYVQYITIPADIATQLAGNKLTSISFSISPDVAQPSQTVAGQIFVTEDPEVTALSDLAFAAKADVKIRDSYQVSPYYQTATFPSGEEYVIKEGTAFAFGVMYEAGAGDYPVGVDGATPNQFAGTAALYQNGNRVGYYPMAYAAGTNLMMYAVTKGEKTQLLDMASVLGLTLDGYTLPIYHNASEAGVYVALNNFGSNNLTSLNLSYKYNDGEYTTIDAPIAVGPGEALWQAVAINGLPAGHNDITVKLNKINSVSVPDNETVLHYINFGPGVEGYDRNFVVEEFTGTWCGWCPRGIVGMEYMQANYPERFIGIAVHASSGSSKDKFEVSNYLPFIEKYASGFPGFIANRDPLFSDDPNASTLEKVYTYWLDQTSPAKLNLYPEIDGKDLIMHATVEYCINDNHQYSIILLLTEDGLTGVQTNYYAGGENGKMDGWESKASKVTWTYTHTAIRINEAFGVKGDDFVVPNHQYLGFAEFPYIGVMNRKNFNLNNTHAIAMLTDVQTGVIVNAVKVPLAELEYDGIDSPVAAPQAPAEYYNIQGQKVANPRAGQIYIRLQDGQAEKVVY